MKTIFLSFIVLWPISLLAQHETNTHEIKASNKLEVELEIYPVNLLHLMDEIIKNEVMFDYHNYIGKASNRLVGIRYFNDVNIHPGQREMTDLIWYTEMYIGLKHWLQLGGEIGSVSGQEYLSFGPEYVDYDNRLFKRVAINTRVFPEFVWGYEYTTQDFEIGKIAISSTGTGRLILPSEKHEIPAEKHVIQSALWFSHTSHHKFFFGAEYEYNSSRSELPHELFLGIKLELS